MIDPPGSMQTYLAAAGLGFTAGTNLFVGSRRAVGDGIPTNAAFIAGAPGARTRTMQQQEEILRTIVTITLRWNSSSGGDTKMRAIHDSLRGKSIAGFLDVTVIDSEPVRLGQDEDGNELFFLTTEMVAAQAVVP